MSTKISSKIWDLRGIPPTFKFILIKLADNANDAGSCWPSVPEIAQECEIGERTVQAAILWAEKAKILHREMRSGRSTVYHMTPADYAPPPPQDEHPRRMSTPATHDIPPPQITQTPPQITESHLYEPSKRTIKEREPSITLDNKSASLFGDGVVDEEKIIRPKLSGEFNEFYAIYPRHVARQNAEKAFNKSRQQGVTHETIIAGATRYREECRGKEQRFIAHAASWLNAGRWDDAAGANRDIEIGANGNARSGQQRSKGFTAIAQEIIREMDERERDIA